MNDSATIAGMDIGFPFTKHAADRIAARRLAAGANAALLYGRVVRTRGAEIFVIGRKEIVRYAREGVDLSGFEGVQVVCSPAGVVLTAYRNRRFRGLRPRGRRRWPVTS
jgi:hypothetical protein